MSPDDTPLEYDIDLSEQAKKIVVPNELHLHFDMGPDASSAMAEKKAESLLEKYYIDTEYRYTIKSSMLIVDTNSGPLVAGYRFNVDARKFIDYGDW